MDRLTVAETAVVSDFLDRHSNEFEAWAKAYPGDHLVDVHHWVAILVAIMPHIKTLSEFGGTLQKALDGIKKLYSYVNTSRQHSKAEGSTLSVDARILALFADAAIRNHGGHTRSSLASILGVPETQVISSLRQLKKTGVITNQGSRWYLGVE